MRLVAALAAGFLAYCAAGWILGAPPRVARRPRVGPTRVQRREAWLRQAGARVSAAQFYAGSALAGAAAFTVLTAALGAWVAAAVPAAIVTLLPHTYYSRQRRTRLAEVIHAWPDGLRDLAASCNARMSLQQAVLALAATGPAPLQRAFAGFATNLQVSGTVPALEYVKAELGDPTSDRVIEVLILAKDRGAAALGQVLTDLADATSAELHTAEQIETARQEPKLNAYVTAALPWALLLLLTVGDTPHRAFYASPGGVLVVAIAAAFSATGVLIVRRLARDAVEQRVFTDTTGGTDG